MLRIKSISITGATTGIGLKLAELYLQDGYRVGICGRDLSKLPAGIKDQYPNLVCFQADVTDREKMRSIINEFAQGGLDVIVANAGISDSGKPKWPNEDKTRQIMATNIEGTLNTFFPALDIFKEQKAGHLVAVASVAGFIGLPGSSAYCASKSAIIQMCESYALDLKPYGINVTAICPGFIDTPLTQKNSHKMPFLLPLDKAGSMVKKAIDKKKPLYVFPWQMASVIHVLRRLPRFIYRRVMTLPAANYSKK